MGNDLTAPIHTISLNIVWKTDSSYHQTGDSYKIYHVDHDALMEKTFDYIGCANYICIVNKQIMSKRLFEGTGILTNEILQDNDTVEIYDAEQLIYASPINKDCYTHACGTQFYITVALEHEWKNCPTCAKPLDFL